MNIAFIPVREGSQSIPLKNIKNFCGKPLVFWTVKAAIEAECIDMVVVATDSDLIKKTVMDFGFSAKLAFYDRDPANAGNTSSTESVMLEYLEKADFADSDLFVLIQATSPMLTARDIVAGFEQLISSGKDSLLSVVVTKRFFWQAAGMSINYDYRNRPRRQDFDGILMENGAFYINRVGNILSDKNRLSGNITCYIMPEYTGTEIDEPDDWMLLEALMKKYILKEVRMPRPEIKLLLSDVDGVLTDAGMYYSEKGDELKKFNTRDGMAFQLLRNAGLKTGIITSEKTRIVENRAAKLQVDFLQQQKCNGGKLASALEICDELGILLQNVAYIGDDVNCYDLLSNVGVAACPADAVEKIKKLSGIIILNARGGEGAFREFADLILSWR